jgi:hypothetical protein
LFPFAQYGGSYTGGYHQADWETNSWLTTEAQNFPLQYEVTIQKVIVRVSDKDNLNSETHIVCQRPNVFNVPYDSDSYLMMELTVGNCKRDSNRLQLSVANAINDIQQISNLKITDSNETNFRQDYLKKDQIPFSQISFNSLQKLMHFGLYWISSTDRTKQFSFTMTQN